MIEVSFFHDDELGMIRVCQNVRAKRLTFRVDEDGLRVTVPKGITKEYLTESIVEMRSQLQELLRKQRVTFISSNYKIKTDHFQLEVKKGDFSMFSMIYKEGCFYFCCPDDFLFHDEKVQHHLKARVVACLRQAAQSYLPNRLKQLAEKRSLSFSNVRISTSQGCWGSCSAGCNINLSLYLMLLPSHLIDYVLLHELAHLREMNHSASFWSILNEFTLGKAAVLRGELKAYSPRL